MAGIRVARIGDDRRRSEWLTRGCLVAVLGTALGGLLGGCGEEEPRSSYFDERIGPILEVNCARQTGGCHLPDARGNVSGNLDLSSYDALMRRQDVLPPFGPYPLGLLLMKVSGPQDIQVETFEPPDPTQPDVLSVEVHTDVRHAAGPGITVGSGGFNEIRRWIEFGHARNGVPVPEGDHDMGPCATEYGFNNFEENRFESATFDPASLALFTSDVQPVLRESCAGERCHGNRLRGYNLACGDDERQIRWNYFISVWFLADPPDRSELLRRPLARGAGGSPHLGGDTFLSPQDGGYQAILGWAQNLLSRDPGAVRELDRYATTGFRFFVNRVEPVLVRKGCMFQNCHSTVAQNQDLQLFAGSGGRFSRSSQHRNHGTARAFLAFYSDDPNQSRIIAKNLYPADLIEGGQGMEHRGGPLFEDFPPTASGVNPATWDDCAGYDVDNGDINDIPGYCIIARWQQIERADAVASGEVFTDIVSEALWIERPLGIGEVTDFYTYRPGADLMAAPTTVAADGSLSLGASRSLLASCGLTQATADVRGPTVSWDGTRTAFAARSSAAEPLRLYWMYSDGSDCERVPGLDAPPEENGIQIHDFDPTFSPIGDIVFASTRGNLERDQYTYQGPTRTPSQMEPNANIYSFSPASGELRQVTYLLNQELQPDFTVEGRLVYTIEKRQPDFHQFALRRMNLDGGDFRPFFGSRPSVGFESTSEVTQLPNLNIAFVATRLHAPDAAGSIGFANISLGVDQTGRDPADGFYLHALRIPRPGALRGGMGVFRSPTALPTGRILVACALGASLDAGGPFDFDLCEMDPQSGATRVVTGVAGRAELEPVAVFQRYVRPSRPVIESDGETLDRPLVEPGRSDAVVVFHDFPQQVGLEFTNIRAPRIIDTRIQGFDVLETLPPPPGATSFAGLDHVVNDAFGPVYVSNRVLGHARLQADGSAAIHLPGGTPLLFRPTDGSGTALSWPAGAPFSGLLMPREEDQYYPGEQARRGIARRLFNNICGFCHAGMSGFEPPVATSPDVVSSPSVSMAMTEPVEEMNIPPANRPAPE